jgi:PTS system mannose-specific IID component
MLLRSLSIQGSWNYKTMLGGGFAFTLLPLLKRVSGGRAPELEAALARHSSLFNAHPYLVGIALGAVARLELEGEAPEVVDRFKAAVRGPLGALGDTLVWTGWLPTTLLGALAAAWAGLPPILCVFLFLTVYNVGHLGLRAWAFRVGFREGRRVGGSLREAGLGHRTELVLKAGTVFLGMLSGVLLVSNEAFGGTELFWPLLAVAAFVLGLSGGLRVWRPAAIAVVGTVILIFFTSALR